MGLYILNLRGFYYRNEAGHCSLSIMISLSYLSITSTTNHIQMQLAPCCSSKCSSYFFNQSVCCLKSDGLVWSIESAHWTCQLDVFILNECALCLTVNDSG